MEKTYKVIGTKKPRIDLPNKATGKALYVDDIMLPHMLHAKVLRAPHAHARILSIDTSKAERLAGVKAVLTPYDVPHTYIFGIDGRDEPFLSWDGIVRYHGQEVAAVAAVDRDVAEEALDLIDVEYEVLPAVLSIQDALAPGAPQVHPEIPGVEGNVAFEVHLERGNAEKGFAQADEVVEQHYVTGSANQAYMEPDGCVASYDSSGRLTVWVSSTWPSNVRDELALVLELPPSKVRVLQNAVGGAFGAKFTGLPVHHIAAALSMKAGRPVKLVLTRTEDLMTVRYRSHIEIDWKMGARRDGMLTAIQSRFVLDQGCGIYMVKRMLTHMCCRSDAMYSCPNIKHDALAVYTNKCPNGTYRSYGDTEMTWGREQTLDMLAEELGISPLKMRLKNAFRRGDISPHGWELNSCALTECLQAVESELGYEAKRTTYARLRDAGTTDAETSTASPEQADAPEATLSCASGPKRRGVGVASTCHETDDRTTNGSYGSVTYIKLLEDGKVNILTGEADSGQGSHNAVAMAAAEELGIPLSDISVLAHDSDVVPWAWGYLGSRVLSSAVEATYRAAQDVKAQCIEVAAELLDQDISDLEFAEGQVRSKSNPEKAITLAQIGRFKIREQQESAAIMGRGIDERPTVYTLGADHPTHYGHSVSATYYDSTGVEVEVDTETGEIAVLDVVVADDCGRVIDRQSIEGQVDGATVQGLGAGLLEERIYRPTEGKLANPNLDDYHVPLATNVPAEIRRVFVESNEPSFCYGHKGGGESPGIGTVIPAVANAVYNAIGVRLTQFPMTPERVLEALAEAGDRGGEQE